MLKNQFFAGILRVNDENSRIRIRVRIRIHLSEAWIHGSVSGSTPKCHGSATLVKSVSQPDTVPILANNYCCNQQKLGSRSSFKPLTGWGLLHNSFENFSVKSLKKTNRMISTLTLLFSHWSIPLRTFAEGDGVGGSCRFNNLLFLLKGTGT